MTVKVTALELRQAGFSDEDIIGHIEEQRGMLNKAGFSNNEINKFYGLKSNKPLISDDQILGDSIQQKGDKPDNIIDPNKTLAQINVEANKVTAKDNIVVGTENRIDTEETVTNINTVKTPTVGDAIVNGEEGPDGAEVPTPNGDTPDYNTTLYENIAKRDKDVAEKYAEMAEKGLIFYDDLTDAEKVDVDMYNNLPFQAQQFAPPPTVKRMVDGVEKELAVDFRKRPQDKIPKNQTILNTTVTTGAASKGILDYMKNDLGLEDDDIATFNEAISFMATVESGNRNIDNEDGTKGGVFQLQKAEMETLLTNYGNFMKETNPEWQQPQWMTNAFVHKNPNQLSVDAQRALAITKLLTLRNQPVLDPDELEVKTSEINVKIQMSEVKLEALKKAYKDGADVATLEKLSQELQELEAEIEKDFQAVENGVSQINREGNLDSYLIAGSRGDVDALKYLYTKVYNPNATSPEHFERVDEIFGTFNTLNYKFGLPEVGTWNTQWGITEKAKATWLGRKIIKYTGGDGTQNVFSNGYRQSVTGLMMAYHQEVAINGKDPQKAYEEIFMHQTQNFAQDIIELGVSIVGDLPQAGVGFVGGLGIGAGVTAATGGTAAPATPFIAFGTAFGLPETMRDVYMRALLNGEVDSFEDLMDEVWEIQTAKTFGKTTTVGSVSYSAGRLVNKVGGGQLSRMSAEAGTMVTLMSAIEGQVPNRTDFAAAAVLIFGAHGAAKGVNKLHHLYKKYGWHPNEVQTLAQQRDDVMVDLLDQDNVEPRYFAELNELYISKMEDATNTKIVENPKHNLNDEVTLSDSETNVGKVKDVQENSAGERVYEVEKPSGETVYVAESQTKKAEPKGHSEIRVEGDKVIVDTRVSKDFVARKAAGQFNNDIIETRKHNYSFVKDEAGVKKTAEALDSALRNDLALDKSATMTVGKGVVATNKVMVDTAFYPKMSSFIKDVGSNKRKEKGTKAEVIQKKFKSIRESEGRLLDEVFTVKRDGPSKMKVDTVVLRGDKGEFFTIERNLYDSLRRVAGKNEQGQNVIRTAEIAQTGDIMTVIDTVTNKVVAAVKMTKANGKLAQQARTYYDNYIPNNQKAYADRVRSSKGDDDWAIPDEPVDAGGAGNNNNIPAINSTWKSMYNSQKGLDTFDLVDLTKALIDNGGPIVERLKPALRGYFQFGKAGKPMPISKKELKVVVNRILAENPKDFTMTLAHEIGHLIDYLPKETMAKGNILGSMAAMKGYMNKWIDGKADGAKPLDPKEIAKLKKEAEAEAAKKETVIDKEITEDLKITPEKILDIFRDPDIRKKIDPEFYEAFAKLDGKLKKLITRSAMRGMIDPHIKSLVDRINGKKPSSDADAALSDQAMEIFKRKFEAEVKERGLVSREEITKELQALSQKWKPFNRNNDPKYTAYRDNPRELMADFMMAFLLRPKWTAINAPKSFDLFMHHMHKRPEVRMKYEEIQNKMAAGSDARYSDQIENLANGFSQNRIDIVKKMDDGFDPNAQDDLQTAYIDTFAYFYRRFGGPNGWWGGGTKRWMDVDTLNLNARIENYRYRHAYMQRYMQSMDSRVIRPIEKEGYNSSQLSVMLLLRNLAFSSQRAGKATTKGLWSQIKDIGPEGEKIFNDFSGFDRNPMDAYRFYSREHPLLDRAATEFYNLRKEYIHPVLKESKAFDKETLDMMLNNKEYITFDQAKYMFKRLDKSGGRSLANKVMKRTTGSLGDITDPLVATLEKDLLILTELKRNRLMGDAIAWLRKNKDWLEDFDAKTGKKEPVVIAAKKSKYGVEDAPIGYKTVHTMENGKIKFYHINKFAADAFDANPYTYLKGLAILQRSNDFFRGVFTEYNPLFWGKNMFRDTGRAVRNLPNARYFDLAGGGKNAYVKYLFKSLKPTWKSIFGDADAFIIDMEKRGMLISQMDGYHTKAGEARINKMIQNGDIPADAALIEKMMQKYTPIQYEKYYFKTFHRFLDYMGNVARVLERSHKVAGKMYLDDMIARGELSMSSAEMMLKIQADVGSPSFLRTSKYHPIMNNVFLFSNAMKEGIRGDYVRLREDPRSVVGKFVAYNVAPKVLQKAMKYGLLGGGLALFYEGISEYDEQNYIIIPLGTTASGKPIYFRVPQDETARVMNGFLGLAIDATFGDGEVGVQNFMKALDSDVLPQFAPIFGLIDDVLTFSGGQNPYDDFRGKYAIDETVWDAQNFRTFQDSVKYMWNSYGGGSLYRFKSDDPTEITSELEEALGFPMVGTFANTFIKVGNHPLKNRLYDDYKVIKREKAKDELLFKGALQKIMSREGTLTAQEIQVVAKRSEYLKNNRIVLDGLSKSIGGTQILQELLSANTTAEKVLIAKRIEEFINEVPDDFPVLFEKE